MPQKKRLIPPEKIYYQRFGQLLYNAIRNKYPRIYMNKADIADKLYHLENDILEKMVQKYLEELKKQ